MTEAQLKIMTAAARAAWLLHAIIDPALEVLRAQGIKSDDRARQMMLTIAFVESRIIYRDQVDTGPAVLGPATSFWQMERGGGVAGVLKHRDSAAAAREACRVRGLPLYTPADPATLAVAARAVWTRIAADDALGAIMARLLLWTDAAPIPSTSEYGLACYLRVWNPGKPHPEIWPGFWAVARNALAS